MQARNGRSTCHKLIDQLRHSDAVAWEEFVAVYNPLIYYWCRNFSISQDDAPDVIQEIFRAVYRGFSQFEHRGAGSFRGWLWTITRSKVIDHSRRLSKQAAPEGGSEARSRLQEFPSPPLDESEHGYDDASAIAIIAQQAAEVAKSEVEPKSWQAFSRVVFDGQSASIVAGQLGMSVGAVYTTKSRILRRIRELLQTDEFLNK